MSLRKIANFLEAAISAVSGRFNNIGEVMLMGMVLLIVADVFLRRVFNSPFPWSFEVIKVMLVVVVFFAVAYCGAKRGHISIGLLVSRFPIKAQAIIDSVFSLAGTWLFGCMAWGSSASAMRLWDAHRITGLLPIPVYPFVFVVAFGSALLALILFAQFLDSLNKVVSK